MFTPLDFEKNVHDLENKLNDLRTLSGTGTVNLGAEIQHLQKKLDKNLKSVYASLTPWQVVQVARHVNRPQFLDYTAQIIEDFTPLAGDRKFAEDAALIGGLGRFRGRPVMVIGHQKGRTTETRVLHNFGMPRPEGYRKAQRLMEMADHFRLPLLTFVDTAGAHPGIQAEERGQAEALARCIETMSGLQIPVVSTIIGEGGSGGAIAIAVSNAVLMLQYAVYATIAPEGCSSILWRTAEKKKEAAQALRLTAPDLKSLKIVDTVIPEPVGGAHRHPQETLNAVADAIAMELQKLDVLPAAELKRQRQAKFLHMGRSLLT